MTLLTLAVVIACSRCGRELTDEVSIRRGIGPGCWALLGTVGSSVRDVAENALAFPFAAPGAVYGEGRKRRKR